MNYLDKPYLNDYSRHFDTTKDSILEDFFTFLKFKSISSEEEFSEELLNCMSWLKEKIEAMSFLTQVWETSGHPILFAENLLAGPNKPTILIYNHYDVQPVDPIELWDHPPFDPVLIDDNVYARGAQDNKGQCMYVYQALKALKSLNGKFPVNIKWIIEGEEETGSKGLSTLLYEKFEELKADYLAIIDLGIPSAKTPSITMGVRGIVTMDVEVTGSTTDLHSGTHGGRAYNPIHALTEILSQLRDKKGQINVPGFYDSVKELSDEEKKTLSFDFDEQKYKQEFGIIPTGGEKAYSPLERSTIRPTIEVNGISGGYTGKGFKTVIPAKAYAKLSARLVSGQDPDNILDNIESFLKSKTPEGIELNVTKHPGKGVAVRANPDSKIVKAFETALTEVFDKKCLYSFEGGSIPIIAELQNVSRAEIVLLGMGLDSDNIHAPNEHFSIDRFKKGFLMVARGLELLGSTT